MVNKGTDEKYWDEVAGKMNNFYVDNPFFRYKKKELMKLIDLWGKIKLSGAVLKTDLYEEALCHDDFLFDLAAYSQDLYGVDISSRMVGLVQKKAEKLNVNLNVSTQDVRNLQFRDDLFDLIISNSTLDHFPEIDQALAEFYRVARKDGVMILTLHNKHNPVLYLLCWVMKNLNRYHDFYTDATYTITEAKTMAQKAGFKVTDTTTIIHILPFLPTIVNILYRSNFLIFRIMADKLVAFFEFIGNKNTFLNNFIGYLIAIKAVKD